MLGTRGNMVGGGWNEIADPSEKSALVEVIKPLLGEASVIFSDFNEIKASRDDEARLDASQLKVLWYPLQVYNNSGYTPDFKEGVALYEFQGTLAPLDGDSPGRSRRKPSEPVKVSRYVLFGICNDKTRVAELLNGQSLPIHTVNKRAPFVLGPDDAAVEDYLRMFCEFIEAAEGQGSFYIVDDPAAELEVSTPPVATPATAVKEADAAPAPPNVKDAAVNDSVSPPSAAATKAVWEIAWGSPPVALKKSGDTTKKDFEACVAFAGQGFLARFSVSADGAVQMTEDAPSEGATGLVVKHPHVFTPVDRWPRPIKEEQPYVEGERTTVDADWIKSLSPPDVQAKNVEGKLKTDSNGRQQNAIDLGNRTYDATLTFRYCHFLHDFSLAEAWVKGNVVFENCVFDGAVDLTNTRALSITFDRCFVQNYVDLTDARISNAAIFKATVAYQLVATGARLGVVSLDACFVGHRAADLQRAVWVPAQIRKKISAVSYGTSHPTRGFVATNARSQGADWLTALLFNRARVGSTISIVNSIVAGSVNCGECRASHLGITDSAVWGDLQVYWMSSRSIQIRASKGSSTPVEIWGQLNAGGLTCQGFEADGMVVHGPVLIFQCDALNSFRWRGVPKPQPKDKTAQYNNAATGGGSTRYVPSKALGGIIVEDSHFKTRFALLGVHVGDPTPAEGRTKEIDLLGDDDPLRRLYGCVTITDCHVGFDLTIAGGVVGKLGDAALRNDPEARGYVENEVSIEGVEIGGDLDLRGLGYRPRDWMDDGRFHDYRPVVNNANLYLENVQIGGNLRCGLADLRRELKGAVPEAELADLASTHCSSMVLRGVTITGDARLDALRTAKVAGDGAVDVLSSVIRGDLSFVDLAQSSPDSRGRFDEISRIDPADRGPLPHHAFVAGRLNLTATKCDHLVISGWCFKFNEGPLCTQLDRPRAGPPRRLLLDLSDEDKERFLLSNGVIFRRIEAHHFELRDAPILRDMDVQDTRVRWWDFPTNSGNGDKAKVFRELLSADPSRNRGTAASIERSLLVQGDVDCAEKIDKLAYEHALEKWKLRREKNERLEGDQKLYRVTYWLGMVWGYGQFRWLFWTFVILLVTTFGLSLVPGSLEHSLAWGAAHAGQRAQRQIVADDRPPTPTVVQGIGTSATQPSTAPSVSRETGTPPRVRAETPAQTQNVEGPDSTWVWQDSLFIALCHVVPIERIDAVENWTPSTAAILALGQRPLVRWVDVFGLISIVSAIWWFLVLLAVSMKVLRALRVNVEG